MAVSMCAGEKQWMRWIDMECVDLTQVDKHVVASARVQIKTTSYSKLPILLHPNSVFWSSRSSCLLT